MEHDDNPDTLFDESKLDANELLELCSYKVTLVSASNLKSADFNGKSDPYCIVSVAGLARTSETHMKTLNPEFNETYNFFTEYPEDIKIEVYDWDKVGKNDVIGAGVYNAKELFETEEVASRAGAIFEGDVPLDTKGTVHLRVVCRLMTPIKTEKLLQLTEAQLQERADEIERQEQLRADAERELEIARSNLADAEAAMGALQDQNRQMGEENQDLRARLEEAKDACTAAEATVADLRTAEDVLKQQNGDLQGRLDDLKEAYATAEGTIGDLNGQISRDKDEVETVRNHYLAEVAEMKAEIDALRKENIELQERAEAVAENDSPVEVRVDVEEPFLSQKLPFCICFGTKCF